MDLVGWYRCLKGLHQTQFRCIYGQRFGDDHKLSSYQIANQMDQRQLVQCLWFQLDRMDSHVLHSLIAKQSSTGCITNDHMVQVEYLCHFLRIFCIIEMWCPFCDIVRIVPASQIYVPLEHQHTKDHWTNHLLKHSLMFHHIHCKFDLRKQLVFLQLYSRDSMWMCLSLASKSVRNKGIFVVVTFWLIFVPRITEIDAPLISRNSMCRNKSQRASSSRVGYRSLVDSKIHCNTSTTYRIINAILNTNYIESKSEHFYLRISFQIDENVVSSWSGG